MCKTILMMLVAVVSRSALAGWNEVGSNETTITYADPATILRSGNMVKMWHLLDYAKPRGIEGIKPYMSAKVQDEYDCMQERSRTLSISFHSGNMGEGEVLGTSTDPGNWRPLVPDTIVDTLRQMACWR